MKRLLTHILTIVVLASCQRVEPAEYEPRLVVEAWICSSQSPVVMLTSSISPDAVLRSVDALEEHILKQATVRLSDGSREVLLKGETREGALPPYVYTSDEMKGEEGKTYSLSIEAAGFRKAKATARIPSAVPLSGISAEKYGDTDTTWLLRARFLDPEGQHNYYKFFSCIEGVDKDFNPTRLDLIDDDVLSPGKEAEVLLLPGSALFTGKEQRSCYYSSDLVHVRFCTMTEEVANLWRVYDTEAVRASLPILSSVSNLPGNVEGALGYFAGYGCYEQDVVPSEL